MKFTIYLGCMLLALASVTGTSLAAGETTERELASEFADAVIADLLAEHA